MSDGFCVLCGRTDRPLEDGLCADCFAARHRLVGAPEHATVVVCPTCGARRVGAHWEGRGRSPTRLGADDLTPLLRPHPEAALRRVDWTDDSLHPLQRSLHGVAHLRFRGTERTESLDLVVKIVHRTCDECSRKSGHFFTATVQLRGMVDDDRERPAERRTRLLRQWETLLPEAPAEARRALSWSEKRPEGWDFFLTDTLQARSLARWMKARAGGTVKESATLWGRKNGQDVYRVTLCLRLPRSAPSPSGGRGARRGTGAPSTAPVQQQS